MTRRTRPAMRALFTAAEDAPLFSGVPMRANVETFNPAAQPQQPPLIELPEVSLSELWRAQLAKTRRTWAAMRPEEVALFCASDVEAEDPNVCYYLTEEK